jgi:sodium/potassium-transporting ATPase subunit alpha
LNDAAKKLLSALQEKLSRNAERVILLCHRFYTPEEVLGSNYFGDEVVNDCVQDLIIIGVLGITDPPRAETAQTVASCRRAGLRFFMVTGDFGLTAAAIARDVGIFTGPVEPDVFKDIVGFSATPTRNQSRSEPAIVCFLKVPKSLSSAQRTGMLFAAMKRLSLLALP